MEEGSEVGLGLPYQRCKHMSKENAREGQDVYILKRLHFGQ